MSWSNSGNTPGARRHRTTKMRLVSRSPGGYGGQYTVNICCPFCGQWVTAYLWSLTGTGKRCPCGAKHIGNNITLPPAPKGR